MDEEQIGSMKIIITNEQKQKLLDIMKMLSELGEDVASAFKEDTEDEDAKEYLNYMAGVVSLSLIAFPWALALNIFVDEGEADKVGLAWSLSEAMSSELAEMFGKSEQSEKITIE